MKVYVYSKNSSRFKEKHNNKIIAQVSKIFNDIRVVDYDEFMTMDIAKIQYLIVSGGDGIIHNVINYCKNYLDNIIFGFIPTGTANDFCNNYNIKSVSKAIEIIKLNDIENRAILEVNDCLVTYALSVGKMSNVSINTNKKEKKCFHKLIYIIKGLKSLFSKKTEVLLVNDFGKKKIFVKVLLILNTKYLGGIRVSNKLVNEGFSIVPIKNIVDIIKLFIFGRFRRLKKYKYNKCLVEANDIWCVDGEKYQCEKGEIKISTNKIRMLSKNT